MPFHVKRWVGLGAFAPSSPAGEEVPDIEPVGLSATTARCSFGTFGIAAHGDIPATLACPHGLPPRPGGASRESAADRSHRYLMVSRDQRRVRRVWFWITGAAAQNGPTPLASETQPARRRGSRFPTGHVARVRRRDPSPLTRNCSAHRHTLCRPAPQRWTAPRDTAFRSSNHTAAMKARVTVARSPLGRAQAFHVKRSCVHNAVACHRRSIPGANRTQGPVVARRHGRLGVSAYRVSGIGYRRIGLHTVSCFSLRVTDDMKRRPDRQAGSERPAWHAASSGDLSDGRSPTPCLSVIVGRCLARTRRGRHRRVRVATRSPGRDYARESLHPRRPMFHVKRSRWRRRSVWTRFCHASPGVASSGHP